MVYVCDGCGAAGRVWAALDHAERCPVQADAQSLVARVRRDGATVRHYDEAVRSLARLLREDPERVDETLRAYRAVRAERDPGIGGAA